MPKSAKKETETCRCFKKKNYKSHNIIPKIKSGNKIMISLN